MIAGTQRQERRGGTLFRRFNTLIKTKSLPNVFKKDFRLRRNSVSIHKIYQNSSQNIKFLGWICAIISIVIIFLIFYESELYFEANFHLTQKIETTRGITLALCFIQCFTVLFVHLDINEKFKNSKIQNLIDLFKNKSRLRYFFIDIFISMIHTPPGISATFKFTQLGFQSEISYSDVIVPLSMLRAKFLLVLVSQQADESKSKAQIILKLFEKDRSIGFILKSVVHKRIYSSFLTCLGLTLIVFGLLLRCFEKHLKILNIYDSFWVGFTTESTVGYGDIYPSTHIGRIIAAIGSVIGVFIFSYNVMAIRNLSSLSKEELNMAYKLRHLNKVQKKLRPKAAELIQRMWRAKRSKKMARFFSAQKGAKDFKFLRNYLSTDISVPLDKQISETGLILSKYLKENSKVFVNIDKISDLSKRYLICSSSNFRKIRGLVSRVDKFSDTSLLDIRNQRSSIPTQGEYVKRRNQAVKNLLIRRANNSNNSRDSPCLSYTSID